VQDVEGKVAVVTGGASGIGYGMARAFLKAGMKVAILDVDEANLAEAKAELAGSNAVHFIKVDVTDRAAMAKAADEVEQVFGKVHLLCNNAGVGGSPSMDEASYADWDFMMGINFGGVVNGVISFLPKLKAHGEGGHIVNTSSMAGLIPLPGDGGIYSASKFAVRGMTESLRLTLAKDRIGVSVLCPGLVRSRIMEAANRRMGVERDEAAMFNSLDTGMDPLEFGQAVLEGVKHNDAFIFAHPEFKDEVRGLFEEILDQFPEGDAPEDRLAFEARRREMTEAYKAGKPG
jgi:NAD(P)-dependent dehydrogenase (short-subunit alcohol dehydrogenase family)